MLPTSTDRKMRFTLVNTVVHEVVLIYCRIESDGKNGVMNPAFPRMHPTKNVIYSCTESVEENGEIVCWEVCPITGKLTLVSSADAFGTSTCYITIDKVSQDI